MSCQWCVQSKAGWSCPQAGCRVCTQPVDSRTGSGPRLHAACRSRQNSELDDRTAGVVVSLSLFPHSLFNHLTKCKVEHWGYCVCIGWLHHPGVHAFSLPASATLVSTACTDIQFLVSWKLIVVMTVLSWHVAELNWSACDAIAFLIVLYFLFPVVAMSQSLSSGRYVKTWMKVWLV